ncbi:hypothetical protein GQ44DRAFT_778824 [Phaeosphaeriaceae sp. PMI808]|nr:hypothetical protein GQ44DRAFT_778824 [Phaeosphaeriaceae sp. PMI808]
MEAIARMSQYGVESFTIVHGVQIARQLPLGLAGQERVRNAINALSSYAGFGKFLFFGYGVRSIPRMLSSHTEGLALVAITAALSEVFHEDYTTQVLHHIVLYLNLDRETTPSLQSWSKIAKSCAGTLATTPFGKKADDFMRYHGLENHVFTRGNHSNFNERWRTCSSAESMAEALVNLGSVAKEEISSITIEGGADTGFLAAVAEWLFNINIVITNENGIVTYTTPDVGSNIHARFILKNRFSESSQNSRQDIFRYPSKVVRLKDVSQALFTNDQDHELVVCGRVQWDQCLSASFNPAFRALLKITMDVSNALGCAARICEAIAKAEPGVDFNTRKNWIYYSDTGSGRGYIQNLVYWFPELKVVESKAQAATDCTFEEARQKYESAIAVIANACNCAICNGTGSNLVRKHCYVLVLETILRAALILSNVSVDPGLQPKISGFERLYERQIQARPFDNDTCTKLQEGLGPAVWVIEPEIDDNRLYTIDHRVRLMIDGAMGLFTHLRELEDSSSCAWSRNGICAYRDILKNFSIYDSSGFCLGRIHIVPGRIEWHGQAIDKIQDWYHEQEVEFRLDNGDGLLNPHELEFGQPSLLMEERVETFNITYQLPNCRQYVVNIPPTHIANQALASYGLVHCRHLLHNSRWPRAVDDSTRYQVQTHLGKEVSIYQVPNDRSSFAALVLAQNLSPAYFVVCDDKCIECALRTLVLEVQTTTVDNDEDVGAKPPPYFCL